MKNFLQNPLIQNTLYILLGLIVLLLLLDRVLLPWYVSSPEVVVPKLTGLNREEAADVLKKLKLEPVIGDTSYDEHYPKGSIMLQRPEAGKVVKQGRRIYIFISGGEPVVRVPMLRGKSVRDAKFSLERIGLKLGRIEEISSAQPKGMIFDQQYEEGTKLKKGNTVSVSISSGTDIGEIIVPDLIGKSLTEARKILSDNNLKVGKINYQRSYSLLPNTILDQYPSSGNKVNSGEAVDLFVTQAAESPEEKKNIE
ncbi:MAG TPA: PASTA domain-containing protein [Ignavibacteriaceae bacterium]|nr:PASTA domain-containing protein [Ignavibacteriaceae bacterium]